MGFIYIEILVRKEQEMKCAAYLGASLIGLALVASSVSLVAVSPAYACGGLPCPPTDEEPLPKIKRNTGFGQEKHGAPQDGENKGSDQGQGVPRGGPGAGMAGHDSKQDGTGLR